MKIADISVELFDTMGTDLSVVNAARVSFAKTSTELSKLDINLIKYLVQHKHWTPFAHCFASFRIKAPIFVARQLAKHQVGLAWNEVSRRYVDEEPEFYFPETWRTRPTGSIKQGSGEAMYEQELWGQSLKEHCANMLAWYTHAIACGMAPEQARMALPLNTMTEWIWSGSLAAWARVASLRLDSHAQQETAAVVAYIAAHMRDLFTVSWSAIERTF